MSSTQTADRALTHRTREVAVELHEVLVELDPAHWSHDVAAAGKRRLEGIARRLGELAEAAKSDPRLASLGRRLNELRQHIATALPKSADAPVEAWIALIERLRPGYESLARALKAYAIHVPALRPTNYARNALHVLTAVAAISVAFLLPTTGWRMLVAGLLAGTCWTLETTRRIWPSWNDKLMAALGVFAHPHETHRVNSATWYLTALFGLTLTGSMPLLAISLAVLGLGDPVAALIGRRFGRIKLLHGRTLEGSLSFVGAATVAATAMALATTSWGLGSAVLVALGASVAGATAEALSRRVDDNFSVPIVAALGATLLADLLGLGLLA